MIPMWWLHMGQRRGVLSGPEGLRAGPDAIAEEWNSESWAVRIEEILQTPVGAARERMFCPPCDILPDH
jgi:hypothetical protein